MRFTLGVEKLTGLFTDMYNIETVTVSANLMPSKHNNAVCTYDGTDCVALLTPCGTVWQREAAKQCYLHPGM